MVFFFPLRVMPLRSIQVFACISSFLVITEQFSVMWEDGKEGEKEWKRERDRGRKYSRRKIFVR